MLKKIAYTVVLTSGLFLAPLGASAHDTPFPGCSGPECSEMPHEHAQKDVLATTDAAFTKMGDRNLQVAEKTKAGEGAFPIDNSID